MYLSADSNSDATFLHTPESITVFSSRTVTVFIVLKNFSFLFQLAGVHSKTSRVSARPRPSSHNC